MPWLVVVVVLYILCDFNVENGPGPDAKVRSVFLAQEAGTCSGGTTGVLAEFLSGLGGGAAGQEFNAVNQQRIKTKVSLGRNTHKRRVWIDWLRKPP